MDAFIDQSLDDIIKKNRGMFRGRGRGNRGRGGARNGENRGGRGGGGSSRGVGGLNRGGGSSSRSLSRGGRGRTAKPQQSLAATATSNRSRGASMSASSRLGPRGGRTARGAVNGWRSGTAGVTPLRRRLAASSPVKRKQTVVARRGGIRTAGRVGTLQSKAVRTKRLALMALQSKRRALQQLTLANQQLKQVDARNNLLLKRRGLQQVTRGVGLRRSSRGTVRGRGIGISRGTTRGGSISRGTTRGIGTSRGTARGDGFTRGTIVRRGGLTQRRSGGQLRRSSAATVTGGDVSFYQSDLRSSARGRIPGSRQRVGQYGARPGQYGALSARAPTVLAAAAVAPDNLLTVQIKNELMAGPRYHQQQQQLDEYDPLEPVIDVSMDPPPPPARAKLNRSGLNPRIQQEIAAIQARGRSQRPSTEDAATTSESLRALRPVAVASGRTMNDRFTMDRVIYS